MKNTFIYLLLYAIIPVFIISKLIIFDIEKKLSSVKILNVNFNEQQKKLNSIEIFQRFLESKDSINKSNDISIYNANTTSEIDINKKTNKSNLIENFDIINNSSKALKGFNDLKELNFNYSSNIWLIKAQIGEPEQEFSLELDTTISTTWVPSVECKNCHTNKKYNASASISARVENQTIKIEDYLADLKGEVVYDNFKINEFKIELKNFSFIQAIELKNKYLDLPEGKLALSNVNKYGQQFSFMNMLIKKKILTKNIFAFEFNENTQSNKDRIGKIYLGDLPERIKTLKDTDKLGFCNSTTSEDLEDDFRDGWTCELTHIFFNKKNKLVNLTQAFEINDARAIFDSSYELIGMSKNQYDLVFQNYIKQNFDEICIKNENQDEIYFICNLEKSKLHNKESFFIILQGYILELTAENLFVKLDENNNYLFGIKFFNIEDDQSKLLLLGHLFLKNFITIYDAEDDKISFYSENVYNIVSEWRDWYEFDYYSLLLTRNFYLLVGACLLVALFLLFIIFLIIRSIKRRNLSHGPLIENEII